MTPDADRTNLDDPSAHYGLDHAPTPAAAQRPRKSAAQIAVERAQRTGTPIDTHGRPIVALPDASTDLDPELVGKSPEEIAAILLGRSSHRDGCDDPKCPKCTKPDEAWLRGNHAVTGGGGSGGGRRRRKKSGGAVEIHITHVYEDEIERDRRPIVVSGRVSIEANLGLNADDVPNAGEILNVIGLALYRGARWQQIAAVIENLKA